MASLRVSLLIAGLLIAGCAAPEAAQVPLIPIVDSTDGFVADFNAEAGKPRLVLILAPS